MDNNMDKSKYPLLATMTSQKAIKCLSPNAQKQLAAELRQYILEVVSHNGGHLSSSLGVVELTIALHSSFDLPKDKIIWDVGHQSYAHKILSGRAEEFLTLRQKNGLSGFPKMSESDFDSFDTGHASTSISAALGYAVARDLNKKDNEVVAVIGDGALTGGLAFEGLNNAGDIKSKLIVVLNDNNKSIADNVGALAAHLARIRTAPSYSSAKKRVKHFFGKLPWLGNILISMIDGVKNMLKTALLSDYIFEELGFVYLGPFDGHDIKVLQEAFSAAKKYNGPVLIHVLTEKGRGYEPARLDPGAFHGVSSFDIKQGILRKSTEKSFTDAFSEALLAEAALDENIMAITAAMTEGTGLIPFSQAYPQRFFDVGIAEAHAVTFAAGLAAAGKKPVCAIYSTFLQRAYDQILHDVCLEKLPVVFAVDRAGLVGQDGETHQGIFDLAFLRTIPNLIIMVPKDGKELKIMLHSAFIYNLPVAIRYPKSNSEIPILQVQQEKANSFVRTVNLSECNKAEEVGMKPEHAAVIPLNSWECLLEGHDMCIIACGSMVSVAMEAAELLKIAGRYIMVINARFVNCVDEVLLKKAASTGKIMTVEEGIEAGGLGGLICEYFASEKNVQVLVKALPDKFIRQGTRMELLRDYGLTAQGLLGFLSKQGW